jgi:3-methyladenine DNA glycosylase/8-oxoguanine DNA glycosylase
VSSASAAVGPGVEIRCEVRPRWPFVLPLRSGLDGLTRVRGRVVHRLLHAGDLPVLVRVAQLSDDRVLFGAQAAERDAAEWGISRMRLALGIDHDLSEFYERFRFDPLIGVSVRTSPGLRAGGKPDPFEALAWAVCEQLIELGRAAAIQRRLVFRLGRGCDWSDLRDAPAASVLAVQAPALLQSMDLSGGRAVALVRAAREVASGRVDLYSSDWLDHERGWRRLRAIPGIGSWTIQMLAFTGQGRLDQLPAGDLGYLKLVGRLRSGGDPYARATEEEVAEFFAPYAPWAGLAGLHALRLGGGSAAARVAAARVAATGVAATGVAATGVAATGVAATRVAAARVAA